MSMDRWNEIAKKEVITDTEAELKDVVENKIDDEYIHAMEYITGMIDKGYDCNAPVEANVVQYG